MTDALKVYLGMDNNVILCRIFIDGEGRYSWSLYGILDNTPRALVWPTSRSSAPVSPMEREPGCKTSQHPPRVTAQPSCRTGRPRVYPHRCLARPARARSDLVWKVPNWPNLTWVTNCHTALQSLCRRHCGIQIGNDGPPFPKRRIEAAFASWKLGDLDLKTRRALDGAAKTHSGFLPRLAWVFQWRTCAGMRQVAGLFTLRGAAPLPHSCQTGQRALQDQKQATVGRCGVTAKEQDGSRQHSASHRLTHTVLRVLRRAEGTVPGGF